MKERPIIFNGEMVRAILDGGKTQTRRVIKPQPEMYDFGVGGIVHALTGAHTRNGMAAVGLVAPEISHINCPYGNLGDRLWVRETWRVGAWRNKDNKVAVDYKADGYCRKGWLSIPDDDITHRLWQQSCADAEKVYGDQERFDWDPGKSPCRYRSPIHMPRWASRITLEITGVRVERLQDISSDDCLAEGVGHPIGTDLRYGSVTKDWNIREYKMLWESINGPGSWRQNPWVWVIRFNRINV